MQFKGNRYLSGMLAALLILLPVGSIRAETLVNGAGASFPYPIYIKWSMNIKS